MRIAVTRAAAGCLTLIGATLAAHAQDARPTVRIGVLSDMSGPFASQAGEGSVVAAQMALEDFGKEAPDLKVELLSADHQNKPDIGSTIARRWLDVDKVDAIVDLPNSAVGIAVHNIVGDKNRVTLASSTATSDLTGKLCRPTTVQWNLDTWALGNATGSAIARAGGTSWFFVSFEYALGQALERDTTAAIAKLGGTVKGSVKHPLGTADFSSYLLQAQSSGAKVLGLAETGTDAINAVKQAGEFGVTGANGMTIAGLFLQMPDVLAIGLQRAQGLILSEPFYWDLDDKTRAWSRRWAERMKGRMPAINHAGVYSSTLAYLRAVRAARTVEGDKVVAQMRAAPIEDELFGRVDVRIDGRAVHAMHVFRVKSPGESKETYDLYTKIATIPAEQAFRPLAEGGCPLVKAP